MEPIFDNEFPHPLQREHTTAQYSSISQCRKNLLSEKCKHVDFQGIKESITIFIT